MKKVLNLARWGSAGFFALLPAAAGAGGLALAPLIAAAGATGLARPTQLRAAATRHRILLILLTAFVGWAVVSTIWSPISNHGQALRLALTAAGGALFIAIAGPDPSARRLTRAAGLAALVTLAGVLAIEALANLPFERAAQSEMRTWVLQRNPGRGVSVLVVLAWPVLGGLVGVSWGRGAWRLVLVAILAVAIGVLSSQFDQQANLLAFGVGLAAFGFGYLAPRIGIALFGGALSLWLLVSPFLTPLLFHDPRVVAALPDTWAIRTEIWKFASARILEPPWQHLVIGRGLDAARTFPDTMLVRGFTTRLMPLHPHSASLQIWLETGAIGAVLAALCLIAGTVSMVRALGKNRAGAAAACGAMAAMGLISNVSFGAWQEWWDATAFVIVALAAVNVTSAKA